MSFLIVIILKIVEIYSYLLLAYALSTWFPNLYRSPIGRFLQWLVHPLLNPFRRFNLQLMGIDFTIVVVMISMSLVSRLLIRLLLLLAG